MKAKLVLYNPIMIAEEMLFPVLLHQIQMIAVPNAKVIHHAVLSHIHNMTEVASPTRLVI